MVVFCWTQSPLGFFGVMNMMEAFPCCMLPLLSLHTPSLICPLTHINMTQHMQVSVLTCATHTCVLWPCIYRHTPHTCTYHTHTQLHSSLLHTFTCQPLHASHTWMCPTQMNRAAVRPGKNMPTLKWCRQQSGSDTKLDWSSPWKGGCWAEVGHDVLCAEGPLSLATMS